MSRPFPNGITIVTPWGSKPPLSSPNSPPRGTYGIAALPLGGAVYASDPPRVVINMIVLRAACAVENFKLKTVTD